jgi:hypothetical protein
MKKVLWPVVLLLMLTVALALPVRSRALDKPEAEAQKAAESWLALTDAGKYAESWSAASRMFKAGVTEEQWQSAMRQYREPLGAVKSRTLSSATARKSLPGVPDGDYVVLRFTSSFEHKQAATETATAQLEKDGSWRISGYFIQ